MERRTAVRIIIVIIAVIIILLLHLFILLFMPAIGGCQTCDEQACSRFWSSSYSAGWNATARPKENCTIEYSEPSVLGGRITQINLQSVQLRDETCLVGCYAKYEVRSFLVGFDEAKTPLCFCDLNDCNPRELPSWYY